jgi:hypothetical protein
MSLGTCSKSWLEFWEMKRIARCQRVLALWLAIERKRRTDVCRGRRTNGLQRYVSQENDADQLVIDGSREFGT